MDNVSSMSDYTHWQMSVNYKQSCWKPDFVHPTWQSHVFHLPAVGVKDVLDLVALVWTIGGNQWLSFCAAALKAVAVTPAWNWRVNPPYPWLKAAERWHTETPILYTDINTSLHTLKYTQKAKLTTGMAGAASD